MKKMTALIPARGGSKGILKKNIKLLMGHPLIAYSIAACKRCSLIDQIVVSTDDPEIAKIAEQYGATIPFLRPEKYALDTSTDNQVLNHFFEQSGELDIAFIRPTTPLRDPDSMSRCIEVFYHNYNTCSSVRSMHELPESPYKMYRLDEEGYCTGFFENFNGEKNYSNLPRQVFPKAYHPNGYIDIVKRGEVITNNTFGEKVFPFITEFCIEVDTQDQFEALEINLERKSSPLWEFLENDKN